MHSGEDVDYFVMSLKPIFAEEILAGRKRFEMRKFFGAIPPGSIVLVYESSPVKAFTGEFKVKSCSIVTEEFLLRNAEAFGVTDRDIPYILGRGKLLLVEVGEVVRYPRRVTLEEVRRYIPGYKPPISYRRVNKGFIELIRRLAYTV